MSQNRRVHIPKEAVEHLMDPARGGSFSSTLKKGATGIATGLLGASVGIAGIAHVLENNPRIAAKALSIARGGSLADAVKFAREHPEKAKRIAINHINDRGGGWFSDEDGLTVAGVSLAGLGVGAAAGAGAMIHNVLTEPKVAVKFFNKALDASGAGFAQQLNQMDQHAWEYMRESASQIIGRKPSKHWPKLKSEQPKHDIKHYENITKIQTPQIAAKMILSDATEGGGFAEALEHVQNFAIDNYEPVEKFLQPFFSRKELIKLIPVIGPGAKQLLTVAEQGIEFVKFLKTLKTTRERQKELSTKDFMEIIDDVSKSQIET